MKKKVAQLIVFAFVLILICGCGKSKSENKKDNKGIVSKSDLYNFNDVKDVDKDIYYVNKNGVEFTKTQYDNLLNFYCRVDIYTISKEAADSIKDDENLTGGFVYDSDLEEIGRISRAKNICKIKENTYKNTEETSAGLNRNEAVKRAQEEINYEPLVTRTCYDSKNDMWRVSLYSFDNGDEVEYINVYMTEKGKTVLITKVNDYAY